MHLPRVFLPDRRSAAADSPSPSPSSSSSPTNMDSRRRPRGRKPRLDRRNAVKNIDYAAWSPSDTSSSSPSAAAADIRSTRSLDAWTSFRVDGVDAGNFDRYCRDLGLSGPEDFAISAAAWEASKARSSSDLLSVSPSKEVDVRDDRFPVPPRVSIAAEVKPKPAGGGCGGIKGNRPPVLAPPPSMSLPVLDRYCSTWELVRSFAPDSVYPSTVREEEEEVEEVVDEDEAEEEGGRSGRLGETSVMVGSCSFTTSNDDDASSTTTEPMFVISPQGRFRRTIRSWEKGNLLGSGSFGTVYEGISELAFPPS